MAQPSLITTLDEFEAEYKAGIGATLPHRPVKEASLDNIRRFGDGVGDYNPLWRDENYAAKSRFGAITAPPTFAYAVALGVIAGETGAIDRARVSTQFLPVNYAGVEIEFFGTIWRGDRITATERVGPTVRKESGRIGAINFNTAFVDYVNERQERVAAFKTLMARFENTGHALEYERAPKASGAAPEAADPLVWERGRRGGQMRHWEDVHEGEALPELPKGTYSVSELFLFTHGVMGTYRSTRAALEASGSAELGGGGRFDAEHASKRRNMPGQFDYGPQRVCWLAQIVTDWMGDDGTLKKLSASIRHPNVVGDTNVVLGEVAGKSIVAGEGLVETRMRVVNQSGLTTAFGTAVVALPRKGA